VIRDADRDPEPDPERACARDWQPVEAPERRREPKREDEPVQRSPTPTDASGPDPDPEPEPQSGPDADTNREQSRTDPAARAHDIKERDHADSRAGADVEPDVGGRHG